MSRPRFRAYPVKGPWIEAGAALLAFLLVLLVGGSYALLGDAKSLAQRAKLEESRKTSAALAEAKAALIGYAVSRQIDPNCTAPGNNCPRLGDLPCPDLTNDGAADNVPICGRHDGRGAGGQSRQLGRLPWKDLRLPDLRDGAGERLWYAVSTNFKVNARSRCTTPSSAGCLNTDSSGTITVKNQDGSYRHDGRNDADGYTKSGAVAVVIAAGSPLRRVGYGEQDRSCTSTCDPRDFLEVGNGEDNATFQDRDTDGDGDGDGSPNGFIQGDVLDSGGSVILNDRILSITYQDLMPLLEKRVVGEVLACLSSYSSYIDPGSGQNINKHRYPWTAILNDLSPPYEDTDSIRFGRVPDPPFTPTSVAGMHNRWADSCLLARFKFDDDLFCNKPGDPPHFNEPTCYRQNWWINWKEMLFYAVAQKYQPDTVVPVEEPSPPPVPPDPPCGTPPCLAVNQSAANGDKRVVVVAAGKRLEQVGGGQPRRTVTDKGDINNYLEGENASPGDDIYELQSVNTSFNDVVCREGLCP